MTRIVLFPVLFSLMLLLLPRAATAADNIRLSTSFSGGTLNTSFEPRGSFGDCSYLLFASNSSSRLKGSFSKAAYLGQFFGGSSTFIARATNVPNFMRTRRKRDRTRKIQFRAVGFCGGRVFTSNRTSLKIPRLTGQGVVEDGEWFAAASLGFQTATVELRRVFVNLAFNQPLDIQNAGDNRMFVAEKDGRIWEFLNDNVTTQKNLFLDISANVNAEGEQGLLGFAFHPDYASNGFVYLHYTRSPNREATISRFHVSADPNALDPASELIILQNPATSFSNHKGGQIAFGPGGNLYTALGDGGGNPPDPGNPSQNMGSLLGKMLRIDVDQTSGGMNYSIPADNPFLGQGGVREEIFASGFRNPFRFSVDTMTGLLWVGDVGQGAFEEIDVAESGKNYGWNIMEGFHCFSPSSGCNQAGLALPQFEYSHNGNSASITGGRVYRGQRNPSLVGKYIYADFIDGRIDAFDPATSQNTRLFSTSRNWSGFGVDVNNELFVLSFDVTDGAVYALTPPGGL